MKEEIGKPEVFAGRDTCGCVVHVMVNRLGHEQFTAERLAEMVRDGLKVEGIALADVTGNFGHKCGKELIPCPDQS